jgi:hypothetical protein
VVLAALQYMADIDIMHLCSFVSCFLSLFLSRPSDKNVPPLMWLIPLWNQRRITIFEMILVAINLIKVAVPYNGKHMGQSKI